VHGVHLMLMAWVVAQQQMPHLICYSVDNAVKAPDLPNLV
jgi:hypothetical protein